MGEATAEVRLAMRHAPDCDTRIDEGSPHSDKLRAGYMGGGWRVFSVLPRRG